MITSKPINIEMSQGWNSSTCSSLVIFMYWACENHTFNATPTESLQEHPLVFVMNRTYFMFFLWRLYLATPSHLGQSTTLFWLKRPSNKCAKLPTVEPSNNKDPMSCSSYFCLFAPHGCCSSPTSLRDESHTHHNANWEAVALAARLGRFFKWLRLKETTKMQTGKT